MEDHPDFPITNKQLDVVNEIIQARASLRLDHERIATAVKRCHGWHWSMTPDRIKQIVDGLEASRREGSLKVIDQWAATAIANSLVPLNAMNEAHKFFFEGDKQMSSVMWRKSDDGKVTKA